MPIGRIKEMLPERGFGFVKDETSGNLIRFNTEEIPVGITQDTIVKFTIVDLDPGSIAINFSAFDSPSDDSDHQSQTDF
ncbi:MAG: hypothetical protein Q8S18_14945 [Bacteroidales bacterium]|nr:hypothetical protein [Bacteroidales bacterium]